MTRSAGSSGTAGLNSARLPTHLWLSLSSARCVRSVCRLPNTHCSSLPRFLSRRTRQLILHASFIIQCDSFDPVPLRIRVFSAVFAQQRTTHVRLGNPLIHSRLFFILLSYTRPFYLSNPPLILHQDLYSLYFFLRLAYVSVLRITAPFPSLRNSLPVLSSLA